jgi:ribosomal protein L31E
MDHPDKRFTPYIPDFSFVLLDLSGFSDEDIKGEVLCRVGLLLLKHVFTPGYEEKIPDILSLLKTLLEKQTGLQYIETVIRYILSTSEDMSAEELKQIVEEQLSAEQGVLTMTIAEQIRQEGIQQGEIRLLCRLMAKKYGLSEKVVRTYLENQTANTLLELGDRILEWDSFDRVEEWLKNR